MMAAVYFILMVEDVKSGELLYYFEEEKRVIETKDCCWMDDETYWMDLLLDIYTYVLIEQLDI